MGNYAKPIAGYKILLVFGNLFLVVGMAFFVLNRVSFRNSINILKAKFDLANKNGTVESNVNESVEHRDSRYSLDSGWNGDVTAPNGKWSEEIIIGVNQHYSFTHAKGTKVLVSYTSSNKNSFTNTSIGGVAGHTSNLVYPVKIKLMSLEKAPVTVRFIVTKK